MFEVLEELTIFTPLGIRFWDPVMDAPVRDTLKVTAVPEQGRGKAVRAFRTASDIYAFNGLPGLGSIERSSYDPEQISSPAIAKKYIVVVDDQKKNFNPVAFTVKLPLQYHGIYLSNTGSSPPQSAPRFILYAAPTRKVPSWLAVIRTELFDLQSNKPAAHAVVRVRSQEGRIWYGLADEMGRIGVFFDYPTVVGTFVGSPRMFVGKPLNRQSWELWIEVLYEPNLLEKLPHTRLPDYLNILSQKPAFILKKGPGQGSPAETGTDTSSLSVRLEFGKALVLRTEGESRLMISPT